MANTKISSLINGNPALTGDLLPMDRAGVNFSVTAGSIASLASPALPAHLTYTDPTLTVSAAGFGSGSVALSGNTSGTATITAPDVAGTATNPVVFSNGIQLPSGTNPNIPLIQFGGGTNGGITGTTAGQVIFFTASIAGSPYLAVAGSLMRILSSMPYTWSSSSSDASVGSDTGLSRLAANSVAVGNSAGGDISGSMTAAMFSTGTATWTQGAGSPEGIVSAPVGSIYSNTTGTTSTSLWVKEAGAGGPTGWVAK